ncbi:MAG: phosphoribosylglycinamide formyltransferase [Candidatus Reconcilbacillus cellulovorans]|uniref:Phosphoribosylglycinamide formyltransferase n=1 Tax=Candidatus Reconcilbacillus cellulovorans TaxID=1906605 RepID=A0A2A6DZX6_9BACL|nr:MAG: phosphoribosylglycinamide formyltransferase [Candidatus Reconcilbacillus cellulovorans]
MEPVRLAVFASGSGSNFQALAEAGVRGEFRGAIELLVTDRPQAKVVERARALGVPVLAFRPKAYASREDYERDVVAALRDRRIDYVLLAGYMRLLTPVMLEAFPNRIVNIHPSLLPAFPGLNAVRQALDYGVKMTGVTVHFVDGGVDTGPIIAQEAVPVEDGDTEETLAERIHAAEHRLYPRVVRWLCEGRIEVEGRRVRIRGAEDG